jgi:hypothetical protein
VSLAWRRQHALHASFMPASGLTFIDWWPAWRRPSPCIAPQELPGKKMPVAL